MKNFAMASGAALALLVTQPAGAAVTLYLQADGTTDNKTDIAETSGIIHSGPHTADGSASIASGQVSAHAIGANTSADATLAALFAYVVAGADANTLTPVTFTFASFDTTPSGSVLTTGSLFDGATRLYTFAADAQTTNSFTYTLKGQSGTLLLNLEAEASGASSFFGSGVYRTEITYPSDATVTFGLTAPRSVGYVLQALPAAAAVPEPATWAMMLAGFGAVGWRARRSGRRSGPVPTGR